MEDERNAIMKLLDSSAFKTLVKSQAHKILKDSQQAQLLRKTGNDRYKKPVHDSRSHHGAWQFYSMSLVRALVNSEDLAMGYGNRSAILLHLSKYEASVRDINRALSITKNDSLKIKLLLRKARCLHMIGSKYYQSILKEADLLLDEMTNESLKNSLQAELDKVKITLKKTVTPNVPSKNKYAKAMKTLSKKHKLGDFSLLEMQFNKKYGKHLVAAKDIRPGEVIYVEKPFVQFVNLLKMHAYCIHCLATVWDNIPCEHCCWAMFCSEKCKKESWEEYHEIECAVYADFKLDTKDSFRQLALRILSRALKKFGSIEKLKAEVSTFDDRTDYKKGFMHNEKLQANGLKSVYFLCKNVPANSNDDHITSTAMIMRAFGKNTSFFGKGFDSTNVESYKKNENAIFLGSLFLRLSKISQLNAFQMWNRSYICENRQTETFCCEHECCTGGTFIAPITGLLNHDCFPNAGRCYTSEHTVVLYAIQPIKKGTQIFTSYLKIFSDDNLANRSKALSDRYNFKCDCYSCQQKLETGMKLNNGLPVMSDVFRHFDAVDVQVAREYQDLMGKAGVGDYENIHCDEQTIVHLRKGLEKAFAPSRANKRSMGTSALVGSLQVVFELMYGIKVDVPNECNNI